MLCVKTCKVCTEVGEIFKPIKRQNQNTELFRNLNGIIEKSVDSASSFEEATSTKKNFNSVDW